MSLVHKFKICIQYTVSETEKLKRVQFLLGLKLSVVYFSNSSERLGILSGFGVVMSLFVYFGMFVGYVQSLLNIHNCCIKTAKQNFLLLLRGFSPGAQFEVAANMKAQHQYRNPPSGTILSITRILSHDGPSVARDLKPGPPEYKSGMLLAPPRCLFVFCHTWNFQNMFPYQYSLYTSSRLSVTTY